MGQRQPKSLNMQTEHPKILPSKTHNALSHTRSFETIQTESPEAPPSEADNWLNFMRFPRHPYSLKATSADFVDSFKISTLSVPPYQKHTINTADDVHNRKVGVKNPQAPTEREWCLASSTAVNNAQKDTVIETSSTHLMINEASRRPQMRS